LDEEYITSEEQQELNNEYLALAKEIGNFIRYLNKSTIKGHKFSGRDQE
jgi:hypothetical protein